MSARVVRRATARPVCDALAEAMRTHGIRAQAERLAARLAAVLNGRNDKVRSLTFGAYLTGQWLPGKKINLAQSTWDGYRRNIDRHILPAVGHLRIRRLRAHHLETLYDRMLHPTDDRRPLAPKTVLEVHLIIRGALKDAVTRGLVNRNVALVAHAPKLKAIPKVEPQAWTAQQLQAFLHAAAGHRLFPAFWVLAATGMRRSELLGLRWDDIDLNGGRLMSYADGQQVRKFVWSAAQGDSMPTLNVEPPRTPRHRRGRTMLNPGENGECAHPPVRCGQLLDTRPYRGHAVRAS